MIRNTAIFGLTLSLCSVALAADPKPCKHGEEAKAAKLDVKVLESLDGWMQRHVDRQRCCPCALSD